ncbi:MAG TPA: tetratricopeptide repeat protein [Thermoanaerobaculia bacterium]|nr:tetratricopeptide repeat protein [Thermoanaerobaculia bacterium]
MRSKSLALCLVVLAFVATNAFAVGEGRINGRILDAHTKEPVPNAVIKIKNASPKKAFNHELKVKGDGSWAWFALDATVPYLFTVSADGYQTYTEEIKIDLGVTTKRDFFLTNVKNVAPTERKVKEDPAVDAYNAGAGLANSGDLKGAAVKFQEAIAAKPDMTAAWIALAKVSHKSKDYPKAIEAANKVLEIDNEDTEMWAVLADSYTATGDKAKAAEASAKVPKNAGALFNEAARLINASNDPEAEKVLKQAIAADGKMAIAYYELGMIYVRSGNAADAKSNLNKYLELEPNGKDAATAKEMLSYLK